MLYNYGSPEEIMHAQPNMDAAMRAIRDSQKIRLKRNRTPALWTRINRRLRLFRVHTP